MVSSPCSARPLSLSADPFAVSDPLIVAYGQRPVVAFNTENREFMVAYLVPATVNPVKFFELRLQRMDINGKTIGPAFDPLGLSGPLLLGKGRPDIAYSPVSNSYLVAVPRLADAATDDDMVLVLQIHADGTTGIYQNIFVQAGGKSSGIYGASPVRVTYNSLDNEFLVSFPHKWQDIVALHSRILLQRMQPDTTLLGGTVIFGDDYLYPVFFISSHSIAYAPVNGGRYALVTGGGGSVTYLDHTTLDQIGYTQGINLGNGGWGNAYAERYADLAYGRIA